jgi:hypothetical protein
MMQLSGLHLEIEIFMLWLSFHLHSVQRSGIWWSDTVWKFKVTVHYVEYKTEKKIFCQQWFI